MIVTDKLIVSVCPLGSFLQKTHNPNIPLQPEEIGDEVFRCWNEGASVVHVHARDKKGIATTDPEVFREIDCCIRNKGCDIIIMHSTSAGRESSAKVDDGPRSLEAKPEMGSMDMGVLQGTRPDGSTFIFEWTRPFHDRWFKYMLDKGIKPELEVFNSGMMEEVHRVIAAGLVTKPYWIQLCFGMKFQQCMRYAPKHVIQLVDLLPEDSMFSVLGIAEAELPVTALSMLLGGHVRVGFEDNYYSSKGVLAESNAQLVARVVRLGRELGRNIATPTEARKLLRIPALKLD